MTVIANPLTPAIMEEDDAATSSHPQGAGDSNNSQPQPSLSSAEIDGMAASLNDAIQAVGSASSSVQLNGMAVSLNGTLQALGSTPIEEKEPSRHVKFHSEQSLVKMLETPARLSSDGELPAYLRDPEIHIDGHESFYDEEGRPSKFIGTLEEQELEAQRQRILETILEAQQKLVMKHEMAKQMSSAASDMHHRVENAGGASPVSPGRKKS